VAGIGFELRRVIGKGGLSRTLGAAIAGVFVVAGPWLLTILSVFLIGLVFKGTRFGFAEQFQGAIIYAYAGSLALFSALHYLFTRIVADLVWESRHGEAAAWMLRFALAAALLSALLSGLVMALVPLSLGGGEGLYRVACVFLFIAVNVMWIVMLFVSLLRRYVAIIMVFAAGMAVAVVLVGVLGLRWGAGGAVLGYALGHALIVVGLATLALIRYRPEKPSGGLAFVIRYAGSFRALILSGALFYLGQWADKFWYWATRGEQVAGTPWRLYAPYDVPVYLAGLSIIPGLVWFVVYSETEISASIHRFLHSLGYAALDRIREAKRDLADDMRRELRDQSLFQLAFSCGAAFLILRGATDVAGGFFEAEGLIRLLAIAGAFSQFTLMTLLNFLYYFERHDEALAGAALFFVLNGIVGPLVQLALPAIPPGSGYLVAAASASALSLALILRSIPDLDRSIFRKALLREDH
jgi:uncharacterized membrane protein